jgi:hypothetical protein
MGTCADDDGVMVPVVAEIGAVADERFDVHGESVVELRIVDFAKIAVRNDHDAANRGLVPRNRAFVFGLNFGPAQIEMSVVVKIGQDFLETFDG